MSRSYKAQHAPPAFSVIEAAVHGDTSAIRAILKHYDGYIRALAMSRYYDDNGVLHMAVDDEIRKMLEIKLISKMLDFKLIKEPDPA